MHIAAGNLSLGIRYQNYLLEVLVFGKSPPICKTKRATMITRIFLELAGLHEGSDSALNFYGKDAVQEIFCLNCNV